MTRFTVSHRAWIYITSSLLLAFVACGFYQDGSVDEGEALTGAMVEQREADEDHATRFDLLQVHKHTTVAHTSSRNDFLQAAMPLAWTHVPKCGTSFVNSLVRLPGVCPGLPMGDTVFGDSNGYPMFDEVFPQWRELCPGLHSFGDEHEILGDHRNVGSYFEDVYHNHGVIMLRQPEQRLMSMYSHAAKLRDLPLEYLPLIKPEQANAYNMKYATGTNDEVPPAGWAYSAVNLIDTYNMTIVDFATATAGCAVRMMTKDGYDWLGCMGVNEHMQFIASLKVTFADVAVARKRLRGYAFVGITDYWPESLCLLHAMFGGECHPAEFADVRVGSLSETGYDIKELQGFVDQYDGALYEEARYLFTQRLRSYGVSQKSCQQCFQAGGMSASDQEKTFRGINL